MIEDVEHRIVKLMNEVKALKSTALFSGEHVPVYEARGTWEGEIDGSEAIDRVVPAVFEMTFTRTDGVKKTPLVDFAFEVEPGVEEGMYESFLTGAITKSTDDSVTFQVILTRDNYGHFSRAYDESTYSFYIVGHVHFKLTGAAYSIVPGKLDIKRVYSWI